MLTFQDAFLLQAEKQEKLAAALEELQVMRATASLGEQQVSAEVVMADCKTEKLEVIHEDYPSFVESVFDENPYFDYLRQSFEEPDCGPMVCSFLSVTDLTESCELRNSTLIAANRIARECRSVWPVDIDRGSTDILQAAVVMTLDSYEDTFWIKVQERDNGALECLFADLCGDISNWLNEYMLEMCEATAQRILSRVFSDTDVTTLSGDGEEEGCWSS